MSGEEKDWEGETLELIREAEQDKEKAVQRLESAKNSITAVDNKIQAMHITLNAYRRKYGVSQAVEISETLVAVYSGMTPSEMLNHEADTHDEEVIMNRLIHDVVAAGAFTNIEQARSTLYRTISRHMEEFWKIEPGQYLRVKSTKLSSENHENRHSEFSEIIENDLNQLDNA